MQALVRKTASSDTSPTARSALAGGLERIRTGLPRGKGWATYPFNTLTLTSHYQPIFSVAGKCPIGYEGLLSAQNLSGQSLLPETVFALSANHDEQLFLDWLTRALHLRNAVNLGENRGLIFLNVYPYAAIEDPHHPEAFASMLENYNIRPSDVVLEILETGVGDDARLVDAVALYRQLGCRIAIDDFGVGFSNFDRIWRLKPDFVKIDRSVLQAALQDGHAQLVLENMIKLIHECGAKAILEGVETRDEALMALHVGADCLQGFFFAPPRRDEFPAALGARMFASLTDPTAEAGRNAIEEYSRLLQAAAAEMQGEAVFAHAMAPFLVMPAAVRGYLVSAEGDSSTVASGEASNRWILEVIEDEDLAGIACPHSGAWQLQHILRRSLSHPGHMQITQPFALADRLERGSTTLTLSYAFQHRGRTLVLCGDLLTAHLPHGEQNDTQRVRHLYL
ncbi:MAG: EAL domain-containing protein [Betaproteobacteria bacterium]|nr:EAL domain-containing protein [Betaproteobacteria bacterium]